MASENGKRNPIVTALAFVLVLVFIFAMPASIIAHNSLRVIFSSDALSQGVSDMLLQEGGLREQLVKQFFTSGWLDRLSTRQDNPFQFLNSRDWIQIANIVFPEEWVKRQVLDGFEAILTWLQNDEPFPKVVLELGPVMERISGDGSKVIIEILVNSWSSCSRDQEINLQRSLRSDSPLNLEFCRPGGDLYADLVDRLILIFRENVSNMQSEIALFGSDVDSTTLEEIKEVKRQFLRLSLWLRWLRLFPFPLLGLIMALVIRSWSDLGQWWGIPAMISSLFGLLLVAIMQRAAPNLINRALSDPGSQAGDIDSIYSILTDITHRGLENSAAHLFITLIVGAGVFGSIWAWSRRHTAVAPEVSTRQPIEDREIDQEQAKEEDPPPPGFSSPPPVKPYDPEGLSNQEE